jgi:uncharacterized protein YqeY
MSTLPERMQADLKTAMRSRDQPAVRALRSALAAFANAEAPPLDGKGPAESYGALVEHERLVLTDDDHRRLLAAEVAEREVAAAEYDAVDRPAEAAEVRAEVEALRPYLSS